MSAIGTYVVLARTVSLVVGGVVTLLAVRAARRTGARHLRTLAVGVGLVAVGGLAATLVDRLTAGGVAVGVGVQSTFTAVGLAVLAYSAYAGPARSGGAAGG
jgi:hypothetical protein